jgi:GT2 family glycosyltransferase
MSENKRQLVSVIVANFNGKRYLGPCFASLLNQDLSVDLEIICVDDNSNDGSYEYVKATYPSVILFKNDRNLGHAFSCNFGIRKAKGDVLFLIDNDTEFDKSCLKNLLLILDKVPSVGCIGGMIKDFGGTDIIQDMGMDIDIFGYGYSKEGSINGHCIKDSGQYDNSIKHCFYISSCGLMIKREVLDKIGLFDDDYFMYKDDLDLCWRAQIAGYDVIVNPNAKIYHKMGVTLGGTSLKQGMKYITTSKKRYYGERNTISTIIKNYDLCTLIWLLPIYLIINMLEFLIFLLSLNFDFAKSYIFAWIWNIKRFKKLLKKRNKIQKTRVISDKNLISRMIIGSAKLMIFLRIGFPKA